MTFAGRLFVGLQYLLPRMALTAAVRWLARRRNTRVKNALICSFVRLFRVDVSEAAAPVPDGFACFNDFFVRELAPGARRIDAARHSVVSPVDGIVSAAGHIDGRQLLQAKGHRYALSELLSTDLDEAAQFIDGDFVTLYLAPRHYHRVHAPLRGRLLSARYVPGDLFSVNAGTVACVAKLFARNERLVCHFLTDSGPLALVFVGALNVGSIGTRWTGDIRPRRHGVVEQLDIASGGTDRHVDKGDLLGWFNMGSTVILLLPRGASTLAPTLVSGRDVMMGEAIATLGSVAP